MSYSLADSLLNALNFSPENVHLRMQVAQLLLTEERFREASEHFQKVLEKQHGDVPASLGLAKSYFHLGKYSAAAVIYEGLDNKRDLEDDILFIKCLLRESSLSEASQRYQDVLNRHPDYRNDEIDNQLRMPAGVAVTGEEEDIDDSLFLEKPAMSFSDVGGMKRVKEEIATKIIHPMTNPSLYSAFGKKVGGGILLYGPPGCGKTFIAKATAGEINSRFISIGLHDILDMWIGNSEKNLHEVFETARRSKPCVLFFDEVDALGASRTDLKQSSMRHLINQFLAEMDGIDSDNEGVLILAATNAPWNVDPAFRRPGRFDRIIFVEPPDLTARQEILRSLLTDKPAESPDLKKLADATPNFSGADLKAVVDIAVENKIRDSMAAGSLQPISTRDLLKAAKSHRPTTSEWFSSARNYALYANESGLYDDILKYLNIR